ncbi:MAG: hypothetical protein E7533_06980 [Ruminococcaceae bacterium]|nr:hypothetical protein [Oscillospiraceae bacterium]
MIRIICSQCKNAYLENNGEKYTCPSCGAEMSAELENLVLGIQNYNEKDYPAAADFLMKYIVKNGADPRAIFYKALCDAYMTIDGETDSISETYEKILECFKDFSKEDFPQYVALANDEVRFLEKAFAEQHVLTLESADAEKIKAEVAAILAIQKEARDFRLALTDVVIKYNETAERKLAVRFSECYIVGKAIAETVGDKTFDKIVEDIENHTVFTGILSTNIKNLEIYLRCIVMFFKRSHEKYEFLKEQSQKFIDIARLLEKGQYNTITGVEAVSEKLIKESYDFLYESYNEHYDEQIDMQTESVIILEPENPEDITIIAEETEAEEADAEEVAPVENGEADVEEAVSLTGEAEESATTDDFVLVADDEPAEAEEAVEEEAVEEEAVAEEPAEADEAEELSEDDIIEIPAEAENEVIETTEEPEDISSSTLEDSEIIVKTLAEVKEEAVAEEITEAPTQEEAEPEKEDEKAEEAEKPEAPQPKQKKKKSKKGLVIFLLVILIAAGVVAYKKVPEMLNKSKYEQASQLAADGKYSEAISAFKSIEGYSDSAEKIKECTYNSAVDLQDKGKYTEAKIIFETLEGYKDCSTRIQTCIYGEATAELEKGSFDKAAELFGKIKEYGNSAEMITECQYRRANYLLENGQYESAISIFKDIKDYSDCKEKINEAKYLYVTNNLDKENKTTVKYLKELAKMKYRNSVDLKKELLDPAATIKSFVNYDVTDMETSLTKCDASKSIYFHVVVDNEEYYNRTLTFKYTTGYGYHEQKTVTFTEANNSGIMAYPAVHQSGYSVTFELIADSGEVLTSQTINF